MSRVDDRHLMRSSKMTRELHNDVMIFNHSGVVRSEMAEQIASVDWFRMYHSSRLLFHVPNETQGTESYQSLLTRMGRVSGVSDLILLHPSPRGYAYGLFEMKSKTGMTSDSQIKILNEQAEMGTFCCVCRGFEAFKRAVKYYLQYD